MSTPDAPTPAPVPQVSEQATPEISKNAEPSTAARLFKGCGCTVAVLALALGILIIGHFDAGAWASALTAIIIVVLVFRLSGVNGFWEN